MTHLARLLVLAGALAGSAACVGSSGEPDEVFFTAAQCSAAVPWAPSTHYAVGAVVTFQGATYQCIQAHTSQSDWTPAAVPALWGLGTCSGGGGAGSGGGGSGSGSGSGSGGGGSGSGSGGGGGTGTAPAGLIFSAYKDISINMNWNTNVISTMVPGSATELASDLVASGGKTITLAFATGECGSENWGGVPGAQMASANVSRLTAAGVQYILSTGGAAGTFTCGSDAGFASFVDRWASPGLIGIDFDIEAGQTPAVIADLIRRIAAAHTAHPGLRFSLTLATLANNNGATTAQSLGAGLADSLNVFGDQTLAAVRSLLGFNGSASTWPSYLTVNLMVMDYGAAGAGVCVAHGGVCDMGQSAIQAAFNLRDHHGVPMANIELTPMIGGNDVSSEHFTLVDVDTMTQFAIANRLAGVHYWSYDRDTDCTQTFASPTCNSLGGVGAHGFLRRFLADGLR
ncbi:MAG TPA: carbohydrate-binding protein [Kofleriaceae bacterium]|nr:carbohydrate-binding protein [Kofleriaceae bacterium]